jgi:hypothetical protein
MTDGYNFIGMTRATGTRSQALVPKPPKPAPYISLGMLSGNNAMSYAQDLQPVGGTRDWNVAVDTDQANTDVTITWPDITTLPRNYRLTLTDTATGQTIDLRHDSSYRYNSAHDAGRRSFIVTARPTTRGSRAVLTNIAVNPGRSGGSRASSVFDIGYTVSQDVRVEASILGFNGQVISVVSPTRAVTSGDNHVVWNGRTSRGDVVPAGAYLLELKAITTDNEVTREIRPLIVTGR